VGVSLPMQGVTEKGSEEKKTQGVAAKDSQEKRRQRIAAT